MSELYLTFTRDLVVDLRQNFFAVHKSIFKVDHPSLEHGVYVLEDNECWHICVNYNVSTAYFIRGENEKSTNTFEEGAMVTLRRVDTINKYFQWAWSCVRKQRKLVFEFEDKDSGGIMGVVTNSDGYIKTGYLCYRNQRLGTRYKGNIISVLDICEIVQIINPKIAVIREHA